MSAKSSLTREKNERIPPRERLLAVAGDLFYRHGIRAVGVEAIAEAAGTNKMTLYRHFASKDELVAEYLRESAKRRTPAGTGSSRRIPAMRWRSCAPGSRRWRATSPAPTSAAAPSPTPRSSCRRKTTRRGASSRSPRSRSATGSCSSVAAAGLARAGHARRRIAPAAGGRPRHRAKRRRRTASAPASCAWARR